MTSKVVYLGDLRTEATHLQSGNSIFTDAPVDNHGKGEAFSPTDLVATSLASCMLTIVGITAQAHNFSALGARAEITKIMSAEPPRRIAEIKIDIFFNEKYDAKQRKLIEAAAHSCPVGKSLHPDLIQTINFHYID